MGEPSESLEKLPGARAFQRLEAGDHFSVAVTVAELELRQVRLVQHELQCALVHVHFFQRGGGLGCRPALLAELSEDVDEECQHHRGSPQRLVSGLTQVLQQRTDVAVRVPHPFQDPLGELACLLVCQVFHHEGVKAEIAKPALLRDADGAGPRRDDHEVSGLRLQQCCDVAHDLRLHGTGLVEAVQEQKKSRVLWTHLAASGIVVFVFAFIFAKGFSHLRLPDLLQKPARGGVLAILRLHPAREQIVLRVGL
mmetsp:Transcript_27120/g.75617  ORF Transcript_27120/g.75617 Transcript_27120/m.75617 type:complete len:253 (-) Transcript_27120:91-849(-)